MQDSGSEITHKIFEGCGKPKLGRLEKHRRSADINKKPANGALPPSQPYHYDTVNTRSITNGRKNKENKFHSNNFDNKRDTDMDKLIRDIKVKVKDSLNVWTNVPYQVCNSDDIATNANNDCWDGNLKE